MKAQFLSFLCLLGLATTAQAQAQDHAIAAKLGLLGIGVEYTYSVNELISIRGSLYGSSYTFDESKSDIDYSLELDFDSLAIGVDFHPTNSPLRLSVGLLRNDNGIFAQNNPTQSFDIGGTTYTAAEVGTLRAGVGFDSTAPYASIGWDWSRSKSFGVSFDLGVISQGSPSVSLTADGLIISDPQFADDIATERAQLQADLDDFDLYPFAALGLNFRF